MEGLSGIAAQAAGAAAGRGARRRKGAKGKGTEFTPDMIAKDVDPE